MKRVGARCHGEPRWARAGHGLTGLRAQPRTNMNIGMKNRNLIKTKAPVALCAGLCLAGGTLPALAQLTGEQAGLLRNAIGNRSELGTILGGSDTIGGGNFTIDADNNQDLDYSLMKFSGRGEIGDPRALGNTGMRWNPFVRGSFGWLNGENDITFGTL